MKNTPNSDHDEQLYSSIHRFFTRFKIVKLLRQCNICKMDGFSCFVVLYDIFLLVFGHKNLYQTIHSPKYGSDKPKKDVFYRFLNNGRFNWRRFLLLVSKSIADVIRTLTSPDREEVFIIDDSLFSRDRSKAVELLAKVYDHVSKRYYRGFRMLTLGWSDGNTFLPIAFSLLSSDKCKNRYQEMNSNLDRRSLAYRRRMESITPATDMIISLLEQALAAGHKASYVLFDSWFAFPKTICKIKDFDLNVICMLKDMPRVFYTYEGKPYRLSKLYGILRKKRGKAKILASVVVTIKKPTTGLPMEVKIVFVRNRNKKRGWLAILSTNISLSDEEIVRIYGKRWDIEVCFKIQKSYLKLAKEFQGRSYDMMTAHTTIVFLRYLMLSVDTRERLDDRSIGGMFYACCDEMQDLNFTEALLFILDLFKQALKKVEVLSETVVNEVLDYFIESLPTFLKRSLGFSGCES